MYIEKMSELFKKIPITIQQPNPNNKKKGKYP